MHAIEFTANLGPGRTLVIPEEAASQLCQKHVKLALFGTGTIDDERISSEADPRRFGKGLKADLAGLWRYRVGDYRILCQIRDRELLVLVVAVGHRRDVYE